MLVYILHFEALLECPPGLLAGMAEPYVRIADARRHLRNILAKVLKTGIVVTQLLLDPQVI